MLDRQIYLSVAGTALAQDSRVHLRGRATMTCSPDCFQCDVYNLAGADRAVLQNAGNLAVVGPQNSVLCQGRIQEILTTWQDGNEITSVFLTDCEDFAHAFTSIALAAEATVTDSIRAVLSHSSAPIPLIHCLEDTTRLHRGQAFHGSTMEAVSTLARAFGGRAYTHRGGLYIMRLGESSMITSLSEDDLLDSPMLFDGGAIIRTEVMGALIGQQMSVQADSLRGTFRAIAQTFDADSLKGSWKTEITLIDEAAIKAGQCNVWEGPI